MRILVVAEKNWLTKNVFELQAFPEALAALGHDVIAIDYNETWSWQGVHNIRWQSRGVWTNVRRTKSGHGIKLYRPGQLLIPGVSRFTGAVDFSMLLREIIQAHKVDIILLYAVPTYGLQTIHIARQYNIPVVFRSIDMLSNLVPVRFLKPLTRFLERVIYKKVSGILVHTPQLGDYVIKMGADPQRVHLLLPPVELNVFHPTQPDYQFAEQWNLKPDDRIILFVGRLFDFSGVPELIEQFAKIANEHPNYKLLIVGQGEILNFCKTLVRDHHLDDQVIFTGYQAFENIPKFINLAHICVTPFKINDTTNNALPGKIAEYLACQKPVLCTPLIGTQRVYPETGAGIVFTNLPAFMRQALILMEDLTLSQSLSREGRDFVISNFSWQSTVQQLEEALHNYMQNQSDSRPIFSFSDNKN